MRSRRNFLIFAGAVIGVLVLALLVRQPVAQRTELDGNNVIFQDNYRLSGDHLNDLVAGGQQVDLDAGSRVTGNTSLLGNTLHVAGAVEGSLTMLGDSLSVDPGASIGKDANLMGKQVTFGGSVAGNLRITADHVTLLPGASIGGKIDVCSADITDQRVGAAQVACVDDGFDPFAALIALRDTSMGATTFGARMDTLATLGFAVVAMVMLTGVSALLVTFFPRQISHIEEAMRARPRSFGGVGIATYALVLGLFFAMTLLLAVIPPLGLLLIPVFLIVLLILFVLNLTGLVTIAILIGDWLLRRVSRLPTPPLIAAVVGSLALSLVLGGIALLPFGFAISFLLFGIVSSVGLGASLFTRVGTRSVGRTYFIQG